MVLAAVRSWAVVLLMLHCLFLLPLVVGVFPGGASFVGHFLLFMFHVCFYYTVFLQPRDHLLGKG